MLDANYTIILNKQSCKFIRLYDSKDDYDIENAPNGSYYDNNENVWCIDIDIDQDEFDLFDHTNDKYKYYEKIFANN